MHRYYRELNCQKYYIIINDYLFSLCWLLKITKLFIIKGFSIGEQYIFKNIFDISISATKQQSGNAVKFCSPSHLVKLWKYAFLRCVFIFRQNIVKNTILWVSLTVYTLKWLISLVFRYEIRRERRNLCRKVCSCHSFHLARKYREISKID